MNSKVTVEFKDVRNGDWEIGLEVWEHLLLPSSLQGGGTLMLVRRFASNIAALYRPELKLKNMKKYIVTVERLFHVENLKSL